MFSNRLAFAALGVACIAAAAGGGYLASRQNTVPAPVAASSTSLPASTPAPAATAERPVEETEALVAEAPKPAPPAPPAVKSSSASSAPKRADSSRAPARGSRPAQTAARQEPQTPPLTSSWPSSASSQPPATPTPSADSARSSEPAAPEPPKAPEPPQKTFEELVVSADSVIGLQTEGKISTEAARVEDRIEAHVSRDVRVGDRVAIPSGAKVLGTVTQVERGGKFKERARLGIRFHTLVLADGTRIPISTETIYRDGESPANSSAAKVGGGAAVGAILGAILGGGKGAAIGAAAGGGAGTTAVMAGDRKEVVLAPGTPMTVRVLSPVTVTTERE